MCSEVDPELNSLIHTVEISLSDWVIPFLLKGSICHSRVADIYPFNTFHTKAQFWSAGQKWALVG